MANYKNVSVQIDTTVKNVSVNFTDQDIIEFIYNSLQGAFGLYIDRDQITIKNEENI